jgi:hypothetical protein
MEWQQIVFERVVEEAICLGKADAQKTGAEVDNTEPAKGTKKEFSAKKTGPSETQEETLEPNPRSDQGLFGRTQEN